METTTRKRVLNAGCGSSAAGRIHPGFQRPGWLEIRLDVDPRTQPDIVASICDMREGVPDASMDGLWSSHTIEHLHEHEVIPAFREMRRVLKATGFALVTCPDLAAVARLAMAGDVESVVYYSPAGPIRAIDMIYGHSRAIEQGHVSMAHKTGYTASRLARVALAAGFAEVRVLEGPNLDLWALLLMPDTDVRYLKSMFAGTNVSELMPEHQLSQLG